MTFKIRNLLEFCGIFLFMRCVDGKAAAVVRGNNKDDNSEKDIFSLYIFKLSCI